MHRRDRHLTSHGGLLTYVNSALRTQRRPDLEHAAIKCLTVEINASQKDKLLLFSCYRPPSQSPHFFFEHLSMLIAKAEKETPHIILLGDLNCKHRA